MAGRAVRLGCPHRTVAEEDRAHAPTLILVLPWRYHSLLVRHPGADRDSIASVLPAGSQRGFRERPVHHDPGRVWLADSVGPLLVSELHGKRTRLDEDHLDTAPYKRGECR